MAVDPEYAFRQYGFVLDGDALLSKG